jgi:hypothetical protein
LLEDKILLNLYPILLVYLFYFPLV